MKKLKKDNNNNPSGSKALEELEGKVEAESRAADAAERPLKRRAAAESNKKQRLKEQEENDRPRFIHFYVMNCHTVNLPGMILFVSAIITFFLWATLYEFDIINGKDVFAFFKYIHISHFFTVQDEAYIPPQVHLFAFFSSFCVCLIILATPPLLLAIKWKYIYSRLPFSVEGLFRLVRRARKEREYAFATAIKIIPANDSVGLYSRNSTEAVKLQRKMLELIMHRANRYFARHKVGVKCRIKEEKPADKLRIEADYSAIEEMENKFYDDMDKHGASAIDYGTIQKMYKEEEERVKRAIEEARQLPGDFFVEGYVNFRLAGKLLKLFAKEFVPIQNETNLIGKILIESFDESVQIFGTKD